MSREVEGLSDLVRDGTLLLGDEQQRKDVVTHGGVRSRKRGPRGARRHSLGVLVR